MGHFLKTLCLFLIMYYRVFAQVDTSSNQYAYHKENINPIIVSKWEIGINLLPLVDKIDDSFGYVIKRNFLKGRGLNALRFKILPVINKSSTVANATNSSLDIAIGYEWQKIKNRFGLLYGLEPSFKYYINSAQSNSSGTGFKTEQSETGISGLVGGRYYVNNHFSFTLESYLTYKFRSISVQNFGNAATANAQEYSFSFSPLHSLYVSYHF